FACRSNKRSGWCYRLLPSRDQDSGAASPLHRLLRQSSAARQPAAQPNRCATSEPTESSVKDAVQLFEYPTTDSYRPESPLAQFRAVSGKDVFHPLVNSSRLSCEP